MTSRDFCFWLQGFFELTDTPGGAGYGPLSVQQVTLMRKHLALVFKHEIDPGMPGAELDAIHAGAESKLAGHGGAGPAGVTFRC